MEPGRTILVIEDDAQTRLIVREALEAAGHRVLESDGVQAGLHLFRSRAPDLVILDIQLPDGSGFEACERMRESQKLGAVPVIMLTGKGALEDKEAGFKAGADQYLVKPVFPKELLLWAGALLRRLEFDSSDGGVLRVGELEIDTLAHLARWRGQAISWLTVKEFELLYFLAKNRPKVLSRQGILSKLWHAVRVDKVVDVHIHNLRRKLPSGAADRIQSVPGKGFRYLEEPPPPSASGRVK